MDGDEHAKDAEGTDHGDALNPALPPHDAPEDRGQEAAERSDHSGSKPSPFDQQLRKTDLFIAVFAGLSTLAAGVSAAVAIWTALQMQASSAQTDAAINKLATLADQTKRQADAQSGQLTFLSQQVTEAKAQTKAISEQTVAIKNSASVAVKSATAQLKSAEAEIGAAQAAARAADAAAASQRPGIALTEFTMSGFKDAPQPKDTPWNGQVKVAFNYQYSNIGGTPWEMVDNAQIIIIDDKIPPIPDYSGASHFPGGGLVIGKGLYMHLISDGYISVDPKTANDVNSGKKSVFVYGIIYYRVFGADHKFCYAYQIPITDGHQSRFVEVGAPAYHCDT